MIDRNKWILIGVLIWYVGLSLWAAHAPAAREFWLLASVLPGLFVLTLVATHRLMPLSNTSYLLITLFLTLHTVDVHYTYAQTPAGPGLKAPCPLVEITMIVWSISVSDSC